MAGLLAFVLLFGMPPNMPRVYATQDTSALLESSTFTPMLRFAVASDVHIRDNANNDYNSRNQLAEFMRTAYAYSDAQTEYTGLDGMFFVGDNTQNGSEISQTYFFNYINEHLRDGTIARAVMGKHEFYAYDYDYTCDAAPQAFLQYSGYEAVDAHLEIKGYHFIFLERQTWLLRYELHLLSAGRIRK